jgi:cell division protein FtsQ
MPRLSAVRTTPARPPARPAGTRTKSKKPAAPQDRLSSRALFLRRVRRNLKPGLWILGGFVVLAVGSELFREMPAMGPVVSPAGSLRHGFGALAADVGFRVGTVKVLGADTTPLPAIEAALGVGPGAPILGFSLQNAAVRIAALGPIQTATVERALPNTLIVTVTERAPYAVWQTAAAGTASAGAPQFVVIDKKGNVIADQDAVAAKRRDPALLLLAGGDAPQNAGSLMTELTDYPLVRAHVAAAARVDGLRWNLILRNNTLVKLPAENEQQAIAQLSQLQANIALLDRPVEVIDLRFAGRLIVRPYPSAAPPPPVNATASQASHT